MQRRCALHGFLETQKRETVFLPSWKHRVFLLGGMAILEVVGSLVTDLWPLTFLVETWWIFRIGPTKSQQLLAEGSTATQMQLGERRWHNSPMLNPYWRCHPFCPAARLPFESTDLSPQSKYCVFSLVSPFPRKRAPSKRKRHTHGHRRTPTAFFCFFRAP